ncbi:uncharacterized protein LOC126846092 isoform X2 [Adelges cooleyi]|nr:uncharacterized protein LOC126846092 isoform X2 [Adelges cooleyi]XP_050441192.1 uncharacterized protein LOC126846092 isoform X2 [Adelges cooleyi]
MTDEEIKGMFTLLDTDKDGWLTLKQFEELMQFSDDELDKELKKYFTEMGTNNRLAYDEFYLLMTKPIEKIYRTQENSKKMLEFMGLFRTNNTEPSKIDS